jgi:hypothetical protein
MFVKEIQKAVRFASIVTAAFMLGPGIARRGGAMLHVFA